MIQTTNQIPLKAEASVLILGSTNQEALPFLQHWTAQPSSPHATLRRIACSISPTSQIWDDICAGGKWRGTGSKFSPNIYPPVI